MLRAIIWAAVSTKEQTTEDKLSLPVQEAQGLTLCEREHWQVVKVLRIPGHSRDYFDIHECAADMTARGITAYNELLELWQNRAFDVFICRDGNRFARTQALHAYVTERTISIGAKIYSFADGWVDSRNYRMWTAMNGYKAAGEIDELKKRHDMGLEGRLERGLSMTNLVRSHRVVYTYGKATGLELNPDYAQLWQDLATLVLEGEPWWTMGVTLFKRYGHTDSTGQPYGGKALHGFLHNPYFWGHSAKNYFKKVGLWVFDEAAPLPDGVKVNRNTHEPVYTGQQAEAVKAELRRRTKDIKGRASPQRTFKFTRLVICDFCGRYYGVGKNEGNYISWRCAGKLSPSRVKCNETKIINDKTIQAAIHEYLVQLRVDGSVRRIEELIQKPKAATELAQVEAQIAAAQTRMARLLNLQLNATNPLSEEVYTEQAHLLDKHLSALAQRRLELQAVGEKSSTTYARREAFAEFMKMDFDVFWSMPPTQINQMLHRIFDPIRFIGRNGKIIGHIEVRG